MRIDESSFGSEIMCHIQVTLNDAGLPDSNTELNECNCVEYHLPTKDDIFQDTDGGLRKVVPVITAVDDVEPYETM